MTDETDENFYKTLTMTEFDMELADLLEKAKLSVEADFYYQNWTRYTHLKSKANLKDLAEKAQANYDKALKAFSEKWGKK